MTSKSDTTAVSRVLAAAAMLTALGAASGALAASSSVNLTAYRTTTTLPDGVTVPMWGYCAPAASATGATLAGGACATPTVPPAAPAAPASWTPGPTIIVPAGNSLTITLSNTLAVPTSLVILGQPGGSLGVPAREGDSPASTRAQHPEQTLTTFPAAGGASFIPPAQLARARSFGAEVAPSASQSFTWATLKPGTYLYETGTRPSLQAPMGLYGLLIVTASVTDPTTGLPLAQSPGQAYPGATVPGLAGTTGTGVAYDADLPFLFSEIDAVQNAATDAAATAGTSDLLSSNDASCTWAKPAGTTYCYPPAVNYAPTYQLINGRAFDRTLPLSSAIAMPGAAATGNVLLRFANAGLKTHIPSVVGLPLSLIAEDGNVAPGLPKVQDEVLLPAGKTFDVLVNPAAVAGAYTPATFTVFDRQLSLSTGNTPNGGMQAFITINGGSAAGSSVFVPTAVGPTAVADTFTVPRNVTSFSGNVLANDVGISNPVVATAATNGGVVLNPATGVFTYTPVGATVVGDSFTYTGMGSDGKPHTATVTLTLAALGAAPVATVDAFSSKLGHSFLVKRPGVLANDSDPAGYALKPVIDTVQAGLTVTAGDDGSISAVLAAGSAAGTYTFSYHVVNAQGTPSKPVTDSITFSAASGLIVTLQDTQDPTIKSVNAVGDAALSDYRWVIEEDTTFKTDPLNPVQANTTATPYPSSLATNFHKSFMPVVAVGCTGTRSCGDSQTYGNAPLAQLPARTLPSDVVLDPTKRYYISILPSDSADGAGSYTGGISTSPAQIDAFGHSMGGASIDLGQLAATVLLPRTPLPPGQLSVFVFEDRNPTNGAVDDDDPGLGGFAVNVFDVRASSGDAAGQMTYDLAGMPLSNSLIGTPGCPSTNLSPANNTGGDALVGVVYTCPNAPVRKITKATLSANGATLSITPASITGIKAGDTVEITGLRPIGLNGSFPVDAVTASSFTVTTVLTATATVGVTATAGVSDSTGYELAGLALIKNINPARLDVFAHPAAARVGAGEHWIQVSTLEGTPANDTFIKAGEPAYWQEFGSPGFHSFIGFMNPDHIKAYNDANVADMQAQQLGAGATVTGRITSLHMDRPPAANLNSSCDGVTTGADAVNCARAALNYTTCYVALNSLAGTGPNIAFATCDSNGNFVLTGVPAGEYELKIWDEWLDQIIAGKSVTVPAWVANAAPPKVAAGDVQVFSWFTRLQQSIFIDQNQNGIRDANEPGVSNLPMNIRFRDGSIAHKLLTDSNGYANFNEIFPLFNWYVLESDMTRFRGTGVDITYDAGGATDTSGPWVGVLNSTEANPLPSVLQVPGAKYFAGTTHRTDPGTIQYEGFQGFINQTQSLDWGKTPFLPGETGGIKGLVYYASTRGFDEPRLEVQFMWEPAVARVPVNLYQEIRNSDGTLSYKLVDQTTTNSWDDFANGTHLSGTVQVPNINCPGQAANDPFIQYTLGPQNQYKCYDGQHVFNQVQPAVYDGRYQFPTAACAICVANPAGATLPKVLPAGKYVVEAQLPPGYEIVKEEDKNILIGDTWIAPVAQQFNGLSNLFILPDQATINSANVQGYGNAFPPCVGAIHVVPDYLTINADAQQLAPFAGQAKPLCDRKEVNLQDQMTGSADFQVFTYTPIAAHFSGMMLNDAAAEFDAVNPSFGEKAALPNAPVSIRDYNGVEIYRTYNDKWGTFNGLTPSNNEPNVPNPSGYAPNMLTNCMNDPGPILDTRLTISGPGGVGTQANPTYNTWIVDPMYNPQYSNFCYVWPFMPGITTYLDTPVLPVSAFASGTQYEPVDCAYPDATPAIARVDGNGTFGPYIDSSQTTRTLTITGLGDVSVLNPNYVGPAALPVAGGTTTNPTITRHYGFGTLAGTASLVAANGTVTPLTISSWGDTKIVATVPATGQTGELVITTAAGRSTVDTVTVTVENSTTAATKVVYVTPPVPNVASATSNAVFGLAHPIQDAIDAAQPGDLILLNAGSYPELVVMWKPVRLQGVGAATTIINATKYPNVKVRDWRTRINYLFGLDDQGNQLPGTPAAQIDPLPGQEITGGIVRLEPSALSTEEGPGITVLAADAPNTTANCTLSAVAPNPFAALLAATPAQRAWSNFACTSVKLGTKTIPVKSRIDGLTVTGGDSGGGIYVNGWAHNLEIANNRVYGNAGPFHGGVRIGQPYLEAQSPGNNGLGYDRNVYIHNNDISENATVEGGTGVGTNGSLGAGAGLSINSGTDNYVVAKNWVCGNYGGGDGAGIGHLGLSRNGQIRNNTIIFNQSYNQGANAHGGGLAIEGEPAAAGAISSGSGSVVVDANLIQGNFAQSGSGGGIRLQQINGSEAGYSRTETADDIRRRVRPNFWFVTLTNNIIVDNVAGWSGGGISFADALNVTTANNTIANNDVVGMVGNLFNYSVNGKNTTANTAVPNPAGVASELTSSALLTALTANRTPAQVAAIIASNTISNPVIVNDVIWHNRSFYFDFQNPANLGVTGRGAASVVVSNDQRDALTHTGGLIPTPAAGGNGCVANVKYWDLGVVGDLAPAAGPTGVAQTATGLLNPTYSILSENVGVYTGAGLKFGGTQPFMKEYCNAGRVNAATQFEPGTPFQPSFAISAAATLDESGNFVDLHYGPLSLNDPATPANANGDYHLSGTGSSAYHVGQTLTGANAVINVTAQNWLAADFDGQTRPAAAGTALVWDIGADQFNGVTLLPILQVTPSSLTFSGPRLSTSAAQAVTLANVGTGPLALNGITLTGSNTFAIASNTCGATLAAGANCLVNITFRPTATVPTTTGAANGNLRIVSNSNNVAGSITLVPLTGTVVTPAATLNPLTHAFGNTATVAAPTTFSFTLTNTGSIPFPVAVAINGGGNTNTNPARPNFTQTNTCGASLAVGGSCTITVSYGPSSRSAAGRTATLTGGAGTAQTATMTGN